MGIRSSPWSPHFLTVRVSHDVKNVVYTIKINDLIVWQSERNFCSLSIFCTLPTSQRFGYIYAVRWQPLAQATKSFAGILISTLPGAVRKENTTKYRTKILRFFIPCCFFYTLSHCSMMLPCYSEWFGDASRTECCHRLRRVHRHNQRQSNSMELRGLNNTTTFRSVFFVSSLFLFLILSYLTPSGVRVTNWKVHYLDLQAFVHSSKRVLNVLQ